MKLVWLATVLASIATIVIEVNSGIIVIICCRYSINIMAFAAFIVVEVTLTSLIDGQFNRFSAVHCIYSNSMCVIRLATRYVFVLTVELWELEWHWIMARQWAGLLICSSSMRVLSFTECTDWLSLRWTLRDLSVWLEWFQLILYKG